MSETATDLVVFYERETGFPLALLWGDKVCRYGDDSYTIDDFRRELEALDADPQSFILVDVRDTGELDSLLVDLLAGELSYVSYLGPFPISMLGGGIPSEFIPEGEPGLPN